MNERKLKNWLEQHYAKSPKGLEELAELRASFGTTLGNVRKENEDRTVFFRFWDAGQILQGVLVVDGMGGMRSGGACASIAVSSFLQKFTSEKNVNLEEKIVSSVAYASKSIFSQFKGEGGATIVGVVQSSDGQCFGFSVGDSRIYLFRDKKIDQISVDDTIDGQLINVRSKIDPNVLGRNHLVQFLGMDERPEVHVFDINKMRTSISTIILTTDGAHNIGNDMLETLYSYSSNDFDFIKKVLCISDWTGGKDNSTIASLDYRFFIDRAQELLKSAGANVGTVEIWSLFGKVEYWLSQVDSNINKVQVYMKKKEPFRKDKKKLDEKKVKNKDESTKMQSDEDEIPNLKQMMFHITKD